MDGNQSSPIGKPEETFTRLGITSIQLAALVTELQRIFPDRTEIMQHAPNLSLPLRMVSAATFQGGVPFYDDSTGVLSWMPLPDIQNNDSNGGGQKKAMVPDFSITFIDGSQIPQVSQGNKTLTFQTIVFACSNNVISTRAGTPITLNLTDPCKT